MSNRRSLCRIPLQLSMTEHAHQQSTRCLSTDLNASGVQLNRLVAPGWEHPRVVGLEFQLPGTADVIWARGEVRFHRVGRFFHRTGLRFTGMARSHERLLDEWVLELQARRLRRTLADLRRSRACCSTAAAAPAEAPPQPRLLKHRRSRAC